MLVTSVEVNLDIVPKASRADPQLIAFVSIVLDRELKIRHIRVIRTIEGKIIVSMPSIKRMDGSHGDMVYPVNSDLRHHIDSAVIAAVLKENARRDIASCPK